MKKTLTASITSLSAANTTLNSPYIYVYNGAGVSPLSANDALELMKQCAITESNKVLLSQNADDFKAHSKLNTTPIFVVPGGDVNIMGDQYVKYFTEVKATFVDQFHPGFFFRPLEQCQSLAHYKGARKFRKTRCEGTEIHHEKVKYFRQLACIVKVQSDQKKQRGTRLLFGVHVEALIKNSTLFSAVCQGDNITQPLTAKDKQNLLADRDVSYGMIRSLIRSTFK